MLKKIFTTALFLVFTAIVNATPITIINGSFDVYGLGNTTLNANGEVVSVDFSFNNQLNPVLATGDYLNYFTNNSVFQVTNPLLLSNVIGVDLWTVDGFTFTGTSVVQNSTSVSGSTGLYIIGDVSHNDFITTSTQWYFSTQFLTNNATTLKSFSSTVTSPAPSTVSEPGTIAILALGLMGLVASRKKKSA
ncbi:PEP-CTERM sorting domain-containing protein [Thalassotalea piscium]|uniref:Ice-binding protein C-terminal domain-containing protein n=1 Tax=Thalassotalea piscium TaxID=1230533 RepID=A0A7X0TUJ9_9GAMM|nr:PEP-CTERM sorting domain-containing protein [Thalassotalea piscium]MBB6544457.1 hypothetical protein [Thalassotalea piscium]